MLQGNLVNPLPMDLMDAVLIFRNWVYILPTRFQSGAEVDSLNELRQKNFRWLLSRQKAIESSSENEAWDPSDKDQLGRLAEMLMFHEAVGGTNYTKLKNEPLEHLDLTDSLADDRCILLGRTEKPMTSVHFHASQSIDSFQAAGESLSLIRFVFPVDAATRP